MAQARAAPAGSGFTQSRIETMYPNGHLRSTRGRRERLLTTTTSYDEAVRPSKAVVLGSGGTLAFPDARAKRARAQATVSSHHLNTKSAPPSAEKLIQDVRDSDRLGGARRASGAARRARALGPPARSGDSSNRTLRSPPGQGARAPRDALGLLVELAAGAATVGRRLPAGALGASAERRRKRSAVVVLTGRAAASSRSRRRSGGAGGNASVPCVASGAPQ